MSDEVIELFCDEHSAYLIVLDAGGALYTNQAGGHLCTHPCARGFLIPLRGPSFEEDLHDWDWSELKALENEWFDSGSYSELFKQLRELPLPKGVRLLRPKELPKLPSVTLEFGEAWLPVFIDPALESFLPYKGRYAILTYPNSD